MSNAAGEDEPTQERIQPHAQPIVVKAFTRVQRIVNAQFIVSYRLMRLYQAICGRAR